MAVKMLCGPCGETISAESQEALIERMTRHSRDAHNIHLHDDEILSHTLPV
jgi:predicted small metal-binding protein